MRYPWGLDYWKSGEWQVVQERLSDLDKLKVQYRPKKNLMFAALQGLRPQDVKVVILGQDPYPSSRYATGVAFSIPANEEIFPPTLRIIFDEYEEDLKYPYPTCGDLTPWTKQGVLLWNILPTCQVGKPMSHNWDEYYYLTWEILDKLADQSIVIACFGSKATAILRPKDFDTYEIIQTSHPSPRGINSSKTPFKGSRIFSTINAKLCEIGVSTVDWRLP